MKFTQYVEHGWKLCGIAPGHKAPVYDAWNVNPIPPDAVGGLDGAGLLHALSGTCALDIDHLELARPWLAERGVDIDALLGADDAVRIDSGRPGRAKLLYRMKRPLRTFKPAKSGLELRCATGTGSSVQDVLPPTVHPDTKKPYQWAFGLLGDWRSLPTIPANLLSLWRDLASGSYPGTLQMDDPAPTKVVIDLVKLRKAAFKHSPDCGYDEWLKVGAQLHDGTRGAVQGFDIWREWTATCKQEDHKHRNNPSKLDSHWRSFSSEPGKLVATGDALVGELPADPGDFEDMPTTVTDAPPPAPEGKAAQRQAALDNLIKRFVFVVFSEEYFDTERNAIIGDKAIRHLMTPLMPRKNGREVDPIDRLMRSPLKDHVEAMAFHPGEKSIFTFEGKRYANTFFPASLPAPLEPMKDEREKIEWLFNRIDDVCFREWLRQFYAHMVQHPATKIRTAPLIWSKIEGNGKSTIAHTIPKLLAGHDYYIGVNQSALNSDFNDYLIGKWVVALTEFRAGSRGDRALITKKAEEWVADDMLQLTIKNGRGCSVPNHLVVTASTNSEDAAQIDEHNRKWAVHKLEAPKMTEEEKAWMFEGFIRGPRARAVLRHYFLHVPITTFSPNADAPKTKGRQEMIESSMPLDLELLITAFEQRTQPLDRDVVITAEVGDYVRRNCIAKPSNDRVGKLLALPPFNGEQKRFRVGAGTYRGMILRNFAHWRNAGGAETMAHITGDDAPLDDRDELLL